MKYKTVCISSAHNLAHARSENRMNDRRWPWEKLVNSGMDESLDVNKDSDQRGEMYTRYARNDMKN